MDRSSVAPIRLAHTQSTRVERRTYAARGFSDFWKRWHISLSEWLRDYLYIPLGGSRRGVPRMILALVLTMFLGGLWHGAGLTFIAWGLLHGGFLVGEHLARSAVGDRAWLRSAVMQWGFQVITFLLVCVTWVFFRAETLGQAGVFLKGMVGSVGWLSEKALLNTEECLLTVGVVGALLVTHHVLRDHEFSGAVSKLKWPVRSGLIAMMVVGIAITPVNNNAFIYFQF